MRISKTILLSGVLAMSLGIAGAAHAVDITQTKTHTGLTDFGSTASPLQFSFLQFDTSLGTLNSVKITLGDDFTSTLLVTNSSGSPSSGNVKTELQSIIADSGASFSTGGNLLTASGALFSKRNDLLTDPTEGTYSLPAGGNTTVSPSEVSGNASTLTLTSGAGFNYFKGAGSALIDYLTFTQTVVSNSGGNTTASQTTNDTLTATVVYSYTPASPSTPEPGSLAMLAGMGVTGSAFVARRRRARK